MKQRPVEIILFLVLLFGFYLSKVSHEPVYEAVKFSGHIADAASAYGVEPALIAAVIHAESNFNHRARSHAGAKGLMQINPPTQKYLKLKNAFDPRENIFAGARYIKELKEKFSGRTHLVLAAYNAGPGAVKRFGGIPPYRETRQYVAKVMKFMKQYRVAFGLQREPLFPGQLL